MDIHHCPRKLAVILQGDGMLHQYFLSLSEEQQEAVAAAGLPNAEAVAAYMDAMVMGESDFFF